MITDNRGSSKSSALTPSEIFFFPSSYPDGGISSESAGFISAAGSFIIHGLLYDTAGLWVEANLIYSCSHSAAKAGKLLCLCHYAPREVIVYTIHDCRFWTIPTLMTNKSILAAWNLKTYGCSKLVSSRSNF